MLVAKLNSSVIIARPVEDVFGFVLALDESAPKTDPDVESVVRTPAGPVGTGTTFRFRQKTRRGYRESTTQFTAVEPNRSIAFTAMIGPLKPTAVLTFEPTSEGTSLTFAGDPNPVGPLKVLGPLINRQGQRVWNHRLARIKAVLEGSAQ